MMRRSLLIIGMMMLVATPASASNAHAQRRFEEANQAYASKDYTKAAALYEAIITRDKLENPKVYLNLGNAYFRSDKLGLAIYAYRRALRLEPSASVQASLNRNLEATRGRLRGRAKYDQTKTQLTDDESLLYVVTHFMSRELLTTSFLVFWLMFIGLLILRRLRPKIGGVGIASITAGLAGLILGLLLWGQVYSDESIQAGIVVTDDALLRESPYEKASGDRVPEGSEVRILAGDDKWLHVKLKGEREGWVAAPEVKRL